MKNLLKATLLAGVSAFAINGAAMASDWTNPSAPDGNINFPGYTAVTTSDGGVTYAGLATSDVNADGTIKTTATACNAPAVCSWVPNATLTQNNFTGSGTDAVYSKYEVAAKNVLTGNSVTASADGVGFANTNGASTTVASGGITYQDGKGGKIEIGGDPTITVSGAGTQTQIVNGATTASGVAGSTYGFAAAGNANTGGGGVAAGVSGSQMGFVVANSGGYATLGASGSDTPSLAVSDGTRTTVLAKDGMSTTNGTHTTTVTANGVTTTGTVSAAVVSAGVLSTTGYSDVGSTLTSYDTRISANAAGISSLGALYSAQQGQINNLKGRMDKAYAGIAMATAFESPQVDPGKHFAISANWGEFDGVSAFSTVGKFRFNDNWSATAGGAVSQGGQFSAKAGIQTQW